MWSANLRERQDVFEDVEPEAAIIRGETSLDGLKRHV